MHELALVRSGLDAPPSGGGGGGPIGGGDPTPPPIYASLSDPDNGTLDQSGQYLFLHGTSMAAPHVSVFGKGPSLACRPNNNPCVAGALLDPQIELRMTADAAGTPMNVFMGSNDQYGSSIGSALAGELDYEGVGFLPTDSNESSLWPTLRPGAYTTILSGKNNSEGIALVEFFEY